MFLIVYDLVALVDINKTKNDIKKDAEEGQVDS